MNRLIAIVGPTAIGKSQLALRLAQTFNGEIVSADSRQAYRYLDIGTAKPSKQELSLVPHHLIDIVEPDADFSLAQYQTLAKKAIDDIKQRGKLPLLVGGSGLYVWSVLEDWGIPRVPPDIEFRHRLEKRAAEEGKDELFQELVQVAPDVAQRIDRNNVRRVIRALEIYKDTRLNFSSSLWHKETPSTNTFIIGLTVNRAELYRRIDLRVDEMIKLGLVTEVEKLVKMGYDFQLPAMSGIGYKQISSFLKDELTLPEAIQQIKFETHRFARHQYNWFRLKDDKIRWFDINGEVDSLIAAAVTRFINDK